MEDVRRAGHDLLRREADALAVVVNSVADLDQQLLQRGLRQSRSHVELVAERAVGGRVVVGHQRHAVAARIRAVEGTVQDVGTQRFLRLDQRLREVTRVGLTDANVIAVFHQHLGQGEGQTVDAVDVALNEQHAARLVGDRHAVRQFRGSPEAVQHRLFMVVPGDALELLEDLRPLVSALIIDAIELFVQDRFDD